MISRRKIKILIVPFLILIMTLSSFSFMVLFGFKDTSELQNLPLVRILLAIIASVIYYFWIKKLNKILPWNKLWIARFLVDLATLLIVSFIAIYIINRSFQMDNNIRRADIFIIPILIHAFFVTITELVLAYEEKTDLAFRLSHIEKLHLNSQYNALKAQLDHHFLFNSLSVLSSIIYEDVERADAFIQRLSSVYRYVLNMNKRDLVTVEEEIDFIKSCLQLYKFRFETGINYNINISPKSLKLLIPPLTLQVLVENSIKHNVVSYSKPLNINIYDKSNKLIVENNIQIRDCNVQSTHTGLQNLTDKFTLLNTTVPVITKDDKNYTVIVTLIDRNND